MPQTKPDLETSARIKVVGAGGSGGKAVTRMVEHKLQGVQFIAINTDAQDLHHTKANKKIHIGKNLTRGLGTGMDPDRGRQAAEENRDEIHEVMKGADMVFVVGGMGGGTFTGCGPVIADVAKQSGALTIGVTTTPFAFEGAQRMRVAEEGIAQLKERVDALITIKNDNLLKIITRETSLLTAFDMCDEVLRQAVQGISDLITLPGIVNLDFADIRAVLHDAGSALMGVGTASGDDRAVEAAKNAINSPLLDMSIDGARGVVFNIAGNQDLTMWEINDAAKVITENVDKEAKIIFGAVHDERLKKGEVKITVIATGFPSEARREEKAEMRRMPMFATDLQKREVRQEATEEKQDEWDAVPAFLRRKK
ncbi:MAG: cell division protein FtsZ [Candidatus Sungbacteria bacterium]|uniref:Cell division protein FtsZ n=1 Tax=Candidatus Sungiibacteriota bacterium TaxID=2750080 RepID=A0A9D6LU41_9BACT|nr:cell division protein FtsZ [Candidatus Sungbacteria bacterium]